jgi:hypothetical protein
MRTRPWLTILVATLASALVWALSPWLSGHREPWDAEGLFYVVALFVAGLLAGLLAPRPLWAHYLGALLGQLGYEAFFLSIGPLFVLGALFLIAYSCIFLVGAAVAGRVRGRTREGVTRG